MTLKEVEEQARKLSSAERRLLALRLLADEPDPRPLDETDPIFNLGRNPVSGFDLREGEDSIWGLGSSPVDCGPSNSSEPDLEYVTSGTPASGPQEAEIPIEEDPLWELGRHPVDIGLTDASVAHDRYLYGSADQK